MIVFYKGAKREGDPNGCYEHELEIQIEDEDKLLIREKILENGFDVGEKINQHHEIIFSSFEYRLRHDSDFYCDDLKILVQTSDYFPTLLN